MTELHLHGPGAAGQSQQLVPEADPEYGDVIPVSSLHDLVSHTVPGYTIQVLELKAQ